MTSMWVMSGRAEAGLPSLALLKSEDGPDTKFPTRLWAQGSFITVCSKDSWTGYRVPKKLVAHIQTVLQTRNWHPTNKLDIVVGDFVHSLGS